MGSSVCIDQLECDGTRPRTGGEVKGKLANAVGNQYPSHYLGTCCIQHYYRWCAHLGCQPSTELTPPPADLNGLVRFAEWRNVVSARGPSHFDSALQGCTLPYLHLWISAYRCRPASIWICHFHSVGVIRVFSVGAYTMVDRSVLSQEFCVPRIFIYSFTRASHCSVAQVTLIHNSLSCFFNIWVNPLNGELNPICHLLALSGAHHILHVSWVRVKGHFNPIKV
jgi:hypothetical protein